MHPILRYQLALARIADLRHEAQQDTLARAATWRRRAGRPPPMSPPPPHMTRQGLTPGGLSELRTEDAAW